MKILLKPAIVFLLLAALTAAAFAQSESGKIDARFRAATIESVLRLLKEKYAYPEMAEKMRSAVTEKQKSGAYDSITDGEKLAAEITADLRAVFDDRHLKISYSAQPISQNSAKAGAPTAEEIAAARRKQTRENFGAARVEILDGNVGLIQLNYFAPLDWSAPAYAAMMNFVADTDALILDLRQNGGSMDVDTAPFISGYLFEKPVQVGELYSRETGATRQVWTPAQVPGRRYLGKPVYILTSRRTASGAEGFVSSLKKLNRAVTIGETTMGATMPGMSHRVNEHFTIWISTGRSSAADAQNENKGIAPDFPVAPEKALAAAHLLILKQLLTAATDEQWQTQLKKFIARLDAAQ
ncbi:MAG TPA: S41 family peptidase [Pyrinomonadaceae bacterium]|jgi:C-terminal processing protease CtpA/Prc